MLTVVQDDGSVAVTFVVTVADDTDIASASLVAEFTDWEPVPMVRADDQTFELTVILGAAGRYQFRYLLDGHRWENDPDADEYQPNGYGTDNSIVVT